MKSIGADALSSFRALENRIERALEALANARREKAATEKALADARSEIRRLRQELEGMRAERLKIRNRVQRLISNIAELDKNKEKKIV